MNIGKIQMAVMPCSNNTNAEQSRALIGIGVPEGSADCIIHNLIISSNDENASLYSIDFVFVGMTYTETAEKYIECGYSDVLPCWSAGQLIGIIKKCCVDDALVNEIARSVFFDVNNGTVDLLVEFISENIESMDFTRLVCWQTN